MSDKGIWNEIGTIWHGTATRHWTRTVYALVARRLQLSHDLCSFNLWNPSFFGIPGILVILSLHCTNYSRIDK